MQIDTISVIERAHHHTLWTRRQDYDPRMLHELQAVDRRVFEYWGHAASYLPISDYRYYLPLKRDYRNPRSKWTRQMLEKHGHLMDSVLERIRVEGPLGSRDFEPPPGIKRGTWWDWKPRKTALELLFWRGDLMVRERRNFQRLYDLTERVLPPETDTRIPDEDELGRFLVRRALSAHGVAREREINTYIHAAGKKTISGALRDLLESGEVLRVAIEKQDGIDYYALREIIQRSISIRKNTPEVILLSPFDNFIIQRDRTKRLFGFDYVLECYVPPTKRRYGYFTVPVLWGESFAGRFDPKADRKNKHLIVRKLVFEPHFKDFDGFIPQLEEKLRAFARFNQCERITIEEVSPSNISIRP